MTDANGRDTGEADLPELPVIKPKEEESEEAREDASGFFSAAHLPVDHYSTSLLMRLTESEPGMAPSATPPSRPLIEEVSSIEHQQETTGSPLASPSLIEEIDSSVNEREKEPLLPLAGSLSEPAGLESQETTKETPQRSLAGTATRVQIEFVGSTEHEDQTGGPRSPSEEAAGHVAQDRLPGSVQEVEQAERKRVEVVVESHELVPTSNQEPSADTVTGGTVTSTSAASANSKLRSPVGPGMEADTLRMGTDTLKEESSLSTNISSSPKQRGAEGRSLEAVSSYDPTDPGNEEPLVGVGGAGGSGHWAIPTRKALIEEITSPTEQTQSRQGSDLILEDLESDDPQVEPQPHESPLASPSGLRLADVPTITDEAEFRRVEAAFDRINKLPPSELSVEDKIWLVAAKGGSTLKDEQIELDTESKQRVTQRLKEADVVDKVSLAF